MPRRRGFSCSSWPREARSWCGRNRYLDRRGIADPSQRRKRSAELGLRERSNLAALTRGLFTLSDCALFRNIRAFQPLFVGVGELEEPQ
jgi:hypothetical protein